MANMMTVNDELQEIVMKIRGTKANAALVRTATANLAELLRSSPPESTFDLTSWQRQWSELEADMRAVVQANNLAEGRGE